MQGVADAVDGKATRKDEVLDVNPPGNVKMEGNRTADRVHPLVQRFGDLVSDIIDEVGIVPRAAYHDVGSRPAHDRVVAGETDKRVVPCEAVDRIGQVAAYQNVGKIVAVEHGHENLLILMNNLSGQAGGCCSETCRGCITLHISAGRLPNGSRLRTSVMQQMREPHKYHSRGKYEFWPIRDRNMKISTSQERQ